MSISGLEISSSFFSGALDNQIDSYYEEFEKLTEEQKWNEILTKGQEILLVIGSSRPRDEARICSQLTSTLFFQGNYAQALAYSERCSRIAQSIKDTELFLKGLYLQSASHRGLARTKPVWDQEASYNKAVELCEEALKIHSEKNIKCISLLAKIHFNLAAAHADNPKGDHEKAIVHYSEANNCLIQAVKEFPNNKQTHRDLQRVCIRLG